MNAHDFADALRDILDEESREEIGRVQTFDEVGMLTRNAGLVVRTPGGDEFQVTVVRSRNGGGD